ncbi:MAG: hypothetical protein KF764_21670 [Labilithrix sp.]|nr:hypothetical protein [Labilithrix sp.]MBX3221894.1 hypothetical protein [Labilithrix sp.]
MPRVTIATLLLTALAGCAKSSGSATAESPNAPPRPTSLPIGVLALPPEPEGAASQASSEAASTDAHARGHDEESEASLDGASGLRAPAPVTPPAPCGLKAIVHDGGARAGAQRFTLTLKNDGTKTLRLVVPGDGSEVGWRTPVVTWSATVHGAPAAPLEGGRCGMMNRIEANEIITLAPGASRSVKDWVPSPPFATGTYDLKLTYRNDPGLESRKGGGESEAVKRLLAGSSSCEVTSNTVRATLP